MEVMKKYRIITITCLIGCLVAASAHALSDKGYRELHVFSRVLHLAEDNYVDVIDEEKTVQGAIRGMLRALDPHSVYMSPEVYRELKVDTSGRFDGVGLEVALRDGWITVVAPIEGSPAAHAGLKTDDQIIAINGRSTENMDLGLAVKLMRGRRGSSVRLAVRRPGVKLPIDFSVMRRKINVPSVKFSVIDGGYGYIKILSFQEGTARAVRKVLKKLKKQGTTNGIVLDLRRNPGGLLEESVAVSDEFLSKGVIVTTERRGKEIERYEAQDDGDELTVPLVMIVDGGSASASEILAGALKDNGRAIVIGTQTFGKGSVQTVFELGDGSALKLTIARYFTPNGTSIQAQGILPDIEVLETPDGEDEKVLRRKVRESDLRGHLERPGSRTKRPAVQSALVRKLMNSDIQKRDAALFRAGKIKDFQKQVAIGYLKYMDTGVAPRGESTGEQSRGEQNSEYQAPNSK